MHKSLTLYIIKRLKALIKCYSVLCGLLLVFSNSGNVHKYAKAKSLAVAHATKLQAFDAEAHRSKLIHHA